MSQALDNAMATIDANCGQLDEAKALVRAKCRALMVGYDARWNGEPYVAVAVEQVYTAPLVNPVTNYPSRSFVVAGKLDVLARHERRKLVVIDHKFTTQDFSQPDAAYWRQLVIEAQATHYMLLLWLNGIKAEGAMWDVIKRPTINPKKLTKAERASTVADRKYFGLAMSNETLAALQTEDRETLEMYEARLAHDCTVERPGYYFARRSIPRLDSEVMQYASDLWQHSQDILASRKVERLPKTSGACMSYNSPCQFLGICSGFDTPDSDRWQSRESRHSELGEHGNIDALTPSRVRTFQTCKQKHRFTYELGIERQEEDKESLYAGTLLHHALEAWWKTFLPQEQDHVNGCETETAGTAGT